MSYAKIQLRDAELIALVTIVTVWYRMSCVSSSFYFTLSNATVLELHYSAILLQLLNVHTQPCKHSSTVGIVSVLPL